MTGRRPWLETAARAAVALFCWSTAAYAFVTSSAFAYQQFIRPRVFPWIGVFGDWHGTALWLWLGALVIAHWRDLSSSGPTRLSAAALTGASAALVAWNSRDPILPRLTDGTTSVTVGVVALAPALAMSLIDHVRSWSWLRRQRLPDSELERQSLEGRLFASLAATAAFLTVAYAVFASLAVAGAFEPDLGPAGLAAGLAWSAVAHLVIASGTFAMLAFTCRLTAGAFLAQYVALSGMLTGAILLAFRSFVADAIGLAGLSGTVAGLLTAGTIVAWWGGARLRGLAASGAGVHWALDLFLGSADERPTARVVTRRLVLVAGFIWLAARAAGRLDWDFLLLKTGVVAVWAVTVGVWFRSLPRSVSPGRTTIAGVCVLALAALVTARALAPSLHAVERYVVYNPSFRVADGVIGGRPPAPAFDRYLRENAGFTDLDIQPVGIDLVPDLGAAPLGPRPDIFLFVIDSLRPDYLSPYNPRVDFTPGVAEFASESLVFEHAFTRYGGTGLSMPAIWAGSALVHKQYVRPFGPMNALDKLLDANGYVKLLGLDHITREIVPPSPAIVELDRGRPEMQFDFCRTIGEIRQHLETGIPARPVFAHTRSLNLHVAAVRSGPVPPGERYPGFHPPYASRVRQMDRCFGEFIAALKQRGLYDRSLIVLTSDHGELLGEDGQWGHSYHMIPEVIQIPLIVHLPGRSRPAVDLAAVALSTDITPTIYAALGYELETSDELAGRSLIDEGRSARRARRGSHVLAASYGAVFAVLRRNGRFLYIANAIRGEDAAYTRVAGGWSAIEVSNDLRSVNQFLIRQHLDAVRRRYGLAEGG